MTFSIHRDIYNKIPNKTIKNNRFIDFVNWTGEKISSPESRLIMGVTALMTQPVIDLKNKNVDKETREVSARRTIAKIIAGTVTGVAIRDLCIKAMDKCTKINGKTAFQKFLLPSEDILNNHLHLRLDEYKKALGTVLSLGIMVFTNFLIDAPLTKFLTNKFLENREKKMRAKNG